MTNSKKINIALMGDFLTDPKFILALAEQPNEITELFLAYDSHPVRICYELWEEIPKKTGCVFVESIELTASNPQNAEKILTALSEIIEAENKQDFVTDGLEQCNRSKYCKKIEINCFADVDKLRELIFDKSTAPAINEITVCLAANELLKRELRELNKEHNSAISVIAFRSVGYLIFMSENSDIDRAAVVSKIHFALQKSDAVLIFEENFHFTERQIKMQERYLRALPAAAFKPESDLLCEKFEDETDGETIRSKYLITAAKGRIKCPGTQRLYEQMHVYPLFRGEHGIYSYGATSGDDGKNASMYNCLAAASMGAMLDKLVGFYVAAPVDLSVLKENYKKYVDLLFNVPEDGNLTEEMLKEFLQGDRPVLSPNGGIAIKSHGKLKFPESCLLAENSCVFLNKLILHSEISEQQKSLLKIKLLHCTDAYSMPDGSVIIRRDILQKAVENARKAEGNAIEAFAEGLIDLFAQS